MANFNAYEHYSASLLNRYDTENTGGVEYSGATLWKEYISKLYRFLAEENSNTKSILTSEFIEEGVAYFNEGSEDMFRYENDNQDAAKMLLKLLLIKLKRTVKPVDAEAGSNCLRLFISHRQRDWVPALHIAQLVEGKMEYWLDILDADLIYVANKFVLEDKYRPLVTACIIEMALINCSHLISLITPHSKGSGWQPYEYGRVTEIPNYFKKVAVLQHAAVADKELPEYLFLGEIFKNESQVKNWILDEIKLVNQSDCSITESEVVTAFEFTETELEEGGQTGYPYKISINIFKKMVKEELIADTEHQSNFLGSLYEWMEDTYNNELPKERKRKDERIIYRVEGKPIKLLERIRLKTQN